MSDYSLNYVLYFQLEGVFFIDLIFFKGIAYFTSAVRDHIQRIEDVIDKHFDFFHKLISRMLNKNQSTHLIPLAVVLQSNTIDC